jgi:cell division protein FtsI (penicillin-binding protein 3)
MKKRGRNRKREKSKRRAVTRTHAFRCATLSCSVIAAGGLTMARAFQLQVVEGEEWSELATSQTTETRPLPAARGGIFDRNGRPLAISRENHAAFYAPAEVRDRQATIEAIDGILAPGSRKLDRLRRATGGWVALGNVDGRTREMLEQAVPRGLHFEPVPARSYPEGRLASTLLGSLDSRGHGRSGLELVFDSLLTGVPGEMVSRRDAHGATFPLRHAGGVAPQPGRDVYLTIDAQLQEIAESALERALSETGATGGDIVLSDPKTGEILALASYVAGAEQRIPAFTDAYEPGSTSKPFLLATLLDQHLVDLDEKIDVEGGSYRTPYRTITDVHAYDTLTVEEVIKYSSNIGAAKLADRIGDRGLQYAYLRDFGFGTPTGIETASESAGLLRRPGRWSPLSSHSLAYGYEMMVTSIQLVAAYGALANGGTLLQPTLIRHVREADGRAVREDRPRIIRRLIDRDVAARVTDVLKGVVRSGTGDEAALRTIDIAGKTGTSRISEDGRYGSGRYVASFVGYVPADDPQLVVLAKLTDPKSSIYGGGAAAPVSRTVVQAILSAAESGLVTGRVAAPTRRPFDWDAQQDGAARRADGAGIPVRFAASTTPRDPEDGMDGEIDPGRNSTGDIVLPDLSGLGLRAAANRLHALGLHVESEASGRVTGTRPAPGTRVVSGARVLLR